MGEEFDATAREGDGIRRRVNALIADVAPVVVELPDADLGLQPFLSVQAVEVVGWAVACAGEADASAPINLTGRRTAALIPGARLIEYAGAGHGLYASDHERLNDDLIGFIRGPAAVKSGQGAGVAVR